MKKLKSLSMLLMLLSVLTVPYTSLATEGIETSQPTIEAANASDNTTSDTNPSDNTVTDANANANSDETTNTTTDKNANANEANNTSDTQNKVVVTYYRNHGNNGSDTYKETYSYDVGQRLEGIRIEDYETSLNYQDQPNNFVSWQGWFEDNSGVPHRAFGKRTIAWNTKADGTGDWYRMGHTITESTPKNLELYMQWISSMELAQVYTQSIQSVKPNITLIGGDQGVVDATEHESKDTALDVDYSQSLNYRAVLDFESIRNELRVLWGRLDKVVNNYGYLEARFDKRLQFEDSVKIAFTSTWLEPDPAKFAEAGVSVTTKTVENAGTTYVFEISKDKLMETKDADGNYLAKLPVKMISRDRLQTLTFDEFMKKMQISVDDQYIRGINTIITPESYYDISTSENPYIVVGGKIDLTIEGRIIPGSSGITPFTINMPQANDEYARLFPHGNIVVNYYENRTNNELVNSKGWHTNTHMGRSAHEAYTDTKGNRTQEFTLENLGVNGYRFVKAEIVQEDGTRIKTDSKGKVISVIKNNIETKSTIKEANSLIGNNGANVKDIKVGDVIKFDYKTSSIINLYFEREVTNTPVEEEYPPTDDKEKPPTDDKEKPPVTTTEEPKEETKIPTEEETKNNVPKKENNKLNSNNSKKVAPKTNDNSLIMVHLVLALSAVFALVVLNRKYKSE